MSSKLRKQQLIKTVSHFDYKTLRNILVTSKPGTLDIYQIQNEVIVITIDV